MLVSLLVALASEPVEWSAAIRQVFDFTIFFDNTKSAKGVCRRLKKSCIVSYFDQQNTLQRSTFAKSGVLNAVYTCGHRMVSTV